MTSTPRSDMRLASSWMVIVSGMVTSRTSFSFVLAVAMAGHALRAAAERRDRALAHFVGAERGDEREAAALLRRAGARRLGRRGGTRRGAARAAAGRAAVVVLGFGRDRARGRRARRSWPCASSSPPKRFLATSSALRLVSSSWRRRSSSVALARLGGFALGALDRVALRRGSSPLPRRSCAPRPRAPWRRRARGRGGSAPPRSACAARRRTASAPAPACGRCGVAPARCGAARDHAAAARRRAACGAGAGAASALASPAPTRRFTFSTTTALERPWLKLWRTTPVSARGLSVSVLVEADAQLFSPGSSYQ